MLFLFSVRRHYTTLLPPTAVRRRLEHTIIRRPKSGWKGFLWQLSFFQPSCWGEVHATTDVFTAHLPMHRSSGPLVRGQWQADASTTGLLAGTSVQLSIRVPLGEQIFGTFLLSLLGIVCLQFGVFTHPTQAPLIPIGMLLFFTLFFVLTGRWSIRRAERFFQEALALSPQAD